MSGIFSGLKRLNGGEKLFMKKGQDRTAQIAAGKKQKRPVFLIE